MKKMKRRKTLTLSSVRGDGSISRIDFQGILSLLKPAVGGAEGLTDFLFADDWVAAYNGELCVAADLPRSTGIMRGVRAEPLILAVDRMEGKELEMRVKGNELHLSAGSSRFGIALQDQPLFKEVVEGFLSIPDGDWKSISNKKLLDAIYFCSFYVSRQAARADMAGVAVIDGDVLSTDGHRITWCRSAGDFGERVFIPPVAASLLPKYIVDSYCIRGGWLCLRREGLLFCIRLLDYVFPDDKVRSFIDKAGKSRGMKIPEELAGVMDRALVFLEHDFLLEKEMLLKVDKGKMLCEVIRKDIGWFKEEVRFEDKKTEFSITVNPIFMREVLRHSASMALVLSGGALKFYSDDFEHMISL